MNPVAAKRLVGQQLENSRFRTPAELVEWMGAVQAQDYLGGLWTVGSRLPGCTESDVEQALAGRKILRTWALRGTIHFVTSSDVGWMLALQAPRQIARNARRYRELELDEATLLRSNTVLVRALEERELTRKQLLGILEENGISTRGQRAPYLLQRASLDGLICQGVTKRNDPTYRLLSDGATSALTRGDAVAELAKRYFVSHGPATIRDFIWWSGLAAADAREGHESVKPHLASETLDGETYWMEPDLPPARSRAAYLLSAYDEYLVSYRNRDAMIDREHRNIMWIGKPTLILDGRVAGTWKRVIGKNAVKVEISPVRSLDKAKVRMVERAVTTYGRFLGKEVEWQL